MGNPMAALGAALAMAAIDLRPLDFPTRGDTSTRKTLTAKAYAKRKVTRRAQKHSRRLTRMHAK